MQQQTDLSGQPRSKIQRRKQIAELSSKRLTFEKLLSSISARFVNLPVDQVDSQIHQAMMQVLDFFQADRFALFQVFPGKKSWMITHYIARDNVPAVAVNTEYSSSIHPWVYEKVVSRKEVVLFSSLDELPYEGIIDKETFQQWPTKSSMIIPLIITERISHVISIHSVQSERVWPKEYIPRLRLLGEIFVNALERRQNRLQVEESLRFESLLTEISARFVYLPSEQVDSEIQNAQRLVCECLHLDLSSLWQWTTETPGILSLTHVYRPLGGPSLPEPMYAQEYFPWSQQQVEAGNIVAISSLEEHPAEAVRDRDIRRHLGIKSVLAIPLSSGGQPPIGALSFATTQKERTWTEALIRRLQLVAQVFISALNRKQAETALRESEMRLTLATESVGAGLWSMAIDTGIVWVSSRCRELFQFAPDEDVHYESFLKVIHPDDRERIDGEVQEKIRSKELFLCDYRIVHPDGSIRWVVSRGQCFLKLNGQSERMVGLTLDITERKHVENQLKDSLEEVQQLRDRLQSENVYLRQEVRLLFKHAEIVGESNPMKEVLSQAEQVSATDSTVLLLGETGTGKELLAHAIHEMSSRKGRVMIVVNCASLPPTLIESELFGREKGAYTGSLTKMIGRFELADGSTLFLDEIGELPLEMQSKLLRVLEQGQFERLGSTKTVRVNVRLIAATNRDLANEVNKGRFRKDLYYRLNVFPITIPPLKERKEDIPSLVWSFVKQFEKTLGKHIDSIPKKNMSAIVDHPWPGNIRELKNVIEHSMILNSSKTLTVSVPSCVSADQPGSDVLQDAERKHILKVLERTGWRISGDNGAAEILGMKRTTLQSKMKILGITRSAS